MVKKALLIGINYRGTASQLEGCIQDTQNVEQFLKDYCDFKDSELTILTDDTEIQPTKANIQSQLLQLVSNVQTGDFLILQYSGHGAYVRDQSGDESDGQDEVLVPLDYSTAGLLSDDWIQNNVLNQIPQGVTLYCFMDCCHSGTVLDLKHNYKSVCKLKKGPMKVNQPFVYSEWDERFLYSRERSRDIVGNVCMFSGALDKEYAADAYIANKSQGAFTFCLLETFKRNIDPTTNKWRANRLKSRHILKEVNCRLDLNGYPSQQCQLSASRQTSFESFLNFE